MTKKLKISHTSLTTYQDCGYKYYLKYKKWIVPYIPIRWPLVSGIAFHDLVDHMYKIGNFSRKFLVRNWKDTYMWALDTESRTFHPIKGYEKQLSYGYGLVYQFHKFADAQGYLAPPMHSEWAFELPHKDITIRGKVDLIMPRKDTQTQIIDFKTSWKLPTEEAVRENKQLTLYDWAVETGLGLKDTISGLFFPRKNTIMLSERTKEHRDKLFSEIDTVAKNITNDVYEPRYEHCERCEFKNYCKWYKK